MTSYNHQQHASGPWQQHREEGDPRAMSIDSDFAAYQKNKGAPQTLQQGPEQTYAVSVAQGAWTGVVSIPRAVSQDQSDEEMSASYTGSSSAQTFSRSSGGDYSSPSATIPENEETSSPLPATSVPRHSQQQRQLNMSALTQRSTSSSGLSFAGMGRYFDHTDANGTAYFSTGGGTFHLADDRSQDSHQTPRYIMETSAAISLSPSPVRSVGDIFQNTSLTPTRMIEYQASDEREEEEKKLSAVNEEKQASYSSASKQQQEEYYSSCQESGHQSSEQASSNNHDFSSCRSNSHQQQPSVQASSVPHQDISSWGSTINHVTEQYSSSTPVETTSSLADGRGYQISDSNQQSSQAGSSWADAPSQQAIPGSQDISPFPGSSIKPSYSNLTQVGSFAKELSSWRSNSIFDSKGGDEPSEFRGVVETTSQQENAQSSQAKGTKTNHADTSVSPQNEEEVQQQMKGSDSDPLYQLQQLSHPSTGNRQGENPLLSPLPNSNSTSDAKKVNGNAYAMNNTSVNVSLGHYLSSCSTSARTSRDEHDDEHEPREKHDNSVLSDINVSAWTQEDSLPPQQEEHTEQQQSQSDSVEEDASRVSGLSMQASEPSVVAETPRKSTNLHLDPTEFASPTTTTKRNSMDIALEESTGYVQRIEELQEELAGKDKAMNELKEHYQHQLEQMHQYTLPLQPHSPYDANNNRYSPDTQNQKLIERNQTLAKEVRFADQTCVELSGRNTALEEKLQVREQELKELRQEHENLTEKVLNSNQTDSKAEVIMQQLQQAHDNKITLEQELHSAKERIESMSKEMQKLVSKHESLMAENNEQVEQLKEEVNSYSTRCNEQDQKLLVQEREYQRLLSERDYLSERVKELTTGVDDSNSAFHRTKAELGAVTRQLEAIRRESYSTDWKLKEMEQRLDEANDLKMRESSEKQRMQQQADYWRKQAECWQKQFEGTSVRLSSEDLPEEGATARADSGKSKVSDDILARAQQSEEAYRRMEKEFASKVEEDLAEVHSALAALAVQFEALNGNSHSGQTAVLVDEMKDGADKKDFGNKINPSLLSHCLASSSMSSNSDVLSPQVIQVLQLILSFTQQHLEVLDKKVARVTTEYTARLAKLHNVVNHIRSSLVFEADSDGFSVSQDGADNGANSVEDNALDATFAAVTSIPDKKVELMEEARSPQKPAPSNIAIPLDNGSPARDTILDLSKIEAVNSPFYSSEITFSLDSEGDKPLPVADAAHVADTEVGQPKSSALRSVQRNVFQKPLEAGRKELERLRISLGTFQKGFWLQRERISSFVESQQRALHQIGAECSSLAGQEAQLLQEKLALRAELLKTEQALNECNAEVEKCTLDLQASQRTESRLRERNESSRQRIMGLEQDIVNMEDRLISNDEHFEKRGNENALSETVNYSQRLKTELEKAVNSRDDQAAELERLKQALKESEDSQERLKLSFVSVNDKLAAAVECAGDHKSLAEELNATKQREFHTRTELESAKREVQEKTNFVESLEAEKAQLKGVKEEAEERLRSLEEENVMLNDKYRVLVSTHDGRAQEHSSLQANFDATKREFELAKVALEDEVKTAQVKLSNALRDSEELQKKLTETMEQKQNSDAEIQRLQEAQSKSEQSLEDFKMSYISSQNKLAEALERTSDYDELVREKVDLEKRLQKAEQEVSHLEEVHSAAVFSVETTSDEHKDLQTKFVVAQQELDQLRQALGTKNEAERKANALFREKEDMATRVKEAEEKNLALRTEVADAIKAKESSVTDVKYLQDSLQQSEATLEKLKNSYVDCQDKLADAQERVANMEGVHEELSLLQETELQLHQEIGAAKEDIDLKAERISYLESSTNEISKERDDLKFQVDEITKKTEEKDLALRETSQQCTALRTEVADKSERISTLEMEIQEVSEERDNLKVKLGELQKEVKESRDAVESMEQLSQVQNAMEKLEAEMGRDLRDAYQRNESLEETLEHLKVSYATVNDKLADVLDKNTKNEALIEELQEASEAAEHLTSHTEEQLMDCRNELEEVRNEKIDLVNALAEAEDEIVGAIEEYAAKQQELADTQNTLENKLLHCATEVRTLRREISKALNPSSCEGEDDGPADVESEVQKLKSMIPSLCESLSALVDKSEWSDDQIQRLNEELQEAKSQIEYSSSKIQKLTIALEEERALHYDDKRKFFWSESARQEAQDRFEEDVGKLYETESQYMDLSSKFAKVTEELSNYKQRAATALEELKSNEQSLVEFRTQKDLWQNRCYKSRSYMRKLTDKIQEWERSYNELLQKCKKLQEKQSKTKRTATNLSNKYSQLADDVQSRDELREEEKGRLMDELGSFRSVHDQLEEELNQIAVELNSVVW